MKKVGFIGWRGMVGSVLLQRMNEEGDFNQFNPTFFSTSQVQEKVEIFSKSFLLEDAYSLDSLKEMDIILTCQGGEYTKSIHNKLREISWGGFWIDASSFLRMSEDSIIVLDPINQKMIDQALEEGKIKNFIGGNCTVSLLLLSLGGLLEEDLVEWVSSMTYQAASGAGAKNMKELLIQMHYLGKIGNENLSDNILALDKKVCDSILSSDYPRELFQSPLAGSLIPWIDSPLENGQTREEWKAQIEANKVLGNSKENHILIDGTCVRVGSMRSHAQGLTVKLKKNVDLATIENLLDSHNEWTQVVLNSKEDTLEKLSPAAVSGTLKIPVGRLRKMNLGQRFLNVFTVGDQLLWGAAEPLRRILLQVIR